MVEVSLTVGKLDASLALLLTKDHHLIEFPTILLPNGVKSGSIVKIRCDRDLQTEEEENEEFQAIQDEILTTFGKNLPQNPILKVKNVTQTSCVLEWDQLDLGTATLKNLVLFKDGKKLGSIPQPLTNRTTKLSGLPIDKSFKFQLRLDTTAGIFSSDTIEVRTHKMTDLSGITVCLGDISPNEQFTIDDIQATLKNMGAHYPAQDKLKVDTTHFITTRENKQNPEYLKANEINIPIIRPEWLKACERERRIVGVRDFYVKDCALPDIFAKNYWQKTPAPIAKDTESSTAEASEPVEDATNGAVEAPATEEVKIESPHANLDEPSNEVPPSEPETKEDSTGDAKAVDTIEEGSVQDSSIPQEEVVAEEKSSEETAPAEAKEDLSGANSDGISKQLEAEDEFDLGSSPNANQEGGEELTGSEIKEASETTSETTDEKIAAVEDELNVAPITAAAVAEFEEVDFAAPSASSDNTFTPEEIGEKIKATTDELINEVQTLTLQPAVSISEPDNKTEETLTPALAEEAEEDDKDEDDDEEEAGEDESSEVKDGEKSDASQKKKPKKKKNKSKNKK